MADQWQNDNSGEFVCPPLIKTRYQIALIVIIIFAIDLLYNTLVAMS